MPGKNHKVAAKKVHIAVIRLSAMGDVAITLPVIQCLLKQHPELEITFVSRPFFKPLFSSFDRVHFFQIDLKKRYKGLWGLYRLYRDLKKRNVTACADLHQVLRSLVLDLFFYLSGTHVKMIDKGRLDKKRLTRCRNKIFKPLPSTHERYAEVFRKLGFDLPPLRDNFLQKPEVSQLRSKGYLIRPELKRIGVAPFAKYDSKTYPSDLMKTVLEALSKNQECEIFLWGAPSEKELLDALFDQQKNIINLAGKLSFKDEIALMAQLDVMLSMDSGNGHIAAAFGVPVVTIWGATHPYAGFAPFGQAFKNGLIPDRERYPCLPTSVFGKTMPIDYRDCMRSIAPESVVKKINEILRKH